MTDLPHKIDYWLINTLGCDEVQAPCSGIG